VAGDAYMPGALYGSGAAGDAYMPGLMAGQAAGDAYMPGALATVPGFQPGVGPMSPALAGNAGGAIGSVYNPNAGYSMPKTSGLSPADALKALGALGGGNPALGGQPALMQQSPANIFTPVMPGALYPFGR